MNLTGLLAQSIQSISKFWAARDARESKMLILAALVGTSGLTYLFLIDPALTGRKQLNKDIPLLHQQVVQMQLLSKETAELASKQTAPLITMSKQNIEAGLAQFGLKAESVMLTGDYAKLQFTTVSFGSTLNWLNEWQKSARVSVVEANVVALAQHDLVNATFTLYQPRN